MKKATMSLKAGLMATIVICWLVPISIVVAMAGFLLGNSYRRSLQQEVDGIGNSAISQVEMHLEDAINSSKAISYDGVIRSAYREYLQKGSGVQLYRDSQDYLTKGFSRENTHKAVFIRFWEDSLSLPYVVADTTAQQVIQTFQSHWPEIHHVMNTEDTAICFLFLDGELYLARNMLDSKFTPYATAVIMVDSGYVFGPLTSLQIEGGTMICLDECRFLMDTSGSIQSASLGPEIENEIRFSGQVDGHALTAAASAPEYDLWANNPWLHWEVITVAAMVLPLLIVIIALFSRHVTQPVQTLSDANRRVQSGQWGYQIDSKPPSVEFETLYANFNAMSAKLKEQLDRTLLEQQATQRAQIKALQSQINPHFLNNTLEIINWEARIGGNERVSAMIEALSTMLDATLDRDSRPLITLRQELVYVDAYLHIIRERLGSRFQVSKQIDERLLDVRIPRLLLQPIVENAVEHDITARRGGNLWVRVFQQESQMVLEVEHDGTLTESDKANIYALLHDSAGEGSQVGLWNVNQRLKLIYGTKATLRIVQTDENTILARICIPTGSSDPLHTGGSV